VQGAKVSPGASLTRDGDHRVVQGPRFRASTVRDHTCRYLVHILLLLPEMGASLQVAKLSRVTRGVCPCWCCLLCDKLHRVAMGRLGCQPPLFSGRACNDVVTELAERGTEGNRQPKVLGKQVKKEAVIRAHVTPPPPEEIGVEGEAATRWREERAGIPRLRQIASSDRNPTHTGARPVLKAGCRAHRTAEKHREWMSSAPPPCQPS
jgi:hypothetical protein